MAFRRYDSDGDKGDHAIADNYDDDNDEDYDDDDDDDDNDDDRMMKNIITIKHETENVHDGVCH